MVREITKDVEVLTTVSTRAIPKSEDTRRVIRDLIDTANQYYGHCVGLAAIQICEPVRIIVAFNGTEFVPFVNPVIVARFGEKYIVEEGCMSLDGTREVERSEGIVVMHQGPRGVLKCSYRGRYAQILQHEIDHLDGKLI